MADESGMLDYISEKIRKTRTDKGITLKEMSVLTGLSVSFLSQVERGSSSLAIPSLKKIAEALDISIVDFFNDTENHRYVTKTSDRKEIRSLNTLSNLILFSSKFPGRKLEPLMVILNPGQNDDRKYEHTGEEFYFVLEGEVIFTIEEREYHLIEGDAIHFPSELPHSWRNPLDTCSRLVGVITPILA